MSLGYKADASAVDAKKYPQYAAGQSCAGCALLPALFPARGKEMPATLA
jgi:hypothetical protein